MGTQEEIQAIEAELKKTKYNKATQGHVGRLKAKLARLKAAEAKKGGGAGLGYAVKKTGDATVILLGFPSVGKSTLLNQLTNADSRVGAYEFTTLKVIPGVLEFRGANIQILDIPGIIQEASAGKGRGKEVLSVARVADLLIVLLAGSPETVTHQREVIEQELYQGGFRLNQEPPDVKIARKSEGGIRVETTKSLAFSKETVKEVMREFRIANGEILIRQKITLDQLIDCLAGNRKYLPALFVINKSDQFPQTKGLHISALKNDGIEKVKEAVWKILEFKRIFLKEPGKPADEDEPLIMRGSVLIKHVAKKFSLDRHFKFAKIWGPSSRFPGQKVGINHQLKDKDAVEIHN